MSTLRKSVFLCFPVFLFSGSYCYGQGLTELEELIRAETFRGYCTIVAAIILAVGGVISAWLVSRKQG